MAKYRIKPVLVEAFKWTGGPDQVEDPEWVVSALEKGSILFTENTARFIQLRGKTIGMEIMTPKGRQTAKPGDYIIQDTKGKIYPCKPDVFEEEYEKVE